ncbi:histidine phosphatase family protein [Sulfitobacter sabulilitoris]|uniref:Histidine phosphatase family protein n=1 Tax=Sulfitobacter sabulilitoris TaxID=2562655 RepID=A0A5S3PBZ7_9RHOB|nr:histidine phosphatase family protein [Sulfitobacter sabulilitoris]TMM51107.1 histidine phosphatase family protein [Sulfitobacter sabulilitoris]
MTTWHWVRHGPTHEKTFVGWRDVPADLSDQAKIDRLRAHLPERAVVIASDLQRASATADAITGAHHVRLPDHPDLRELDFGVWDGMHVKDVAARDPDLSRAYWDTPGDIRAPQGESWNMTAARVNAVVDHINRAHRDAHVIAVAHFGVILTQIQRALGIPATEAFTHKIDNLSVTRITWQGGTGAAPLINHSP